MQYFKTIVIQILKFIINLLFPFDDRLATAPKNNVKTVDPQTAKTVLVGFIFMGLFMFFILLANVQNSEFALLIKAIYLSPTLILVIIPIIISSFSKNPQVQLICSDVLLASLWYLFFIAISALTGIHPDFNIAILTLIWYVIISFLFFVVFYRINFYRELKHGSIINSFKFIYFKKGYVTGSGAIIGYLFFRSIPFVLLLVVVIYVIYFISFISANVIESRKLYRYRILEQQSEPPEIREARERAILEEKERNMTKEEKKEILKAKLDKWAFPLIKSKTRIAGHCFAIWG